VPDAAVPVSPGAGPGADAAGPRPTTVLVVDDEQMILRSTRAVLECAGFRVVTADGGERALEAVRAERPDVVLLDIMMPEVDGWETLSLLRGDPSTRELPVVIFTAREHARGRQLACEMGAVDYVQKPYDPDALAALLRAHVDRRRGGGG
jgi:DNA-binding response OmpR family regulator